jgi:hypothetical protein
MKSAFILTSTQPDSPRHLPVFCILKSQTLIQAPFFLSSEWNERASTAIDDIRLHRRFKIPSIFVTLFPSQFLLNWFRYLRPNDELVPNRARRFGGQVQDFSASINRIYKAESYSSLQVEPARYLPDHDCSQKSGIEHNVLSDRGQDARNYKGE